MFKESFLLHICNARQRTHRLRDAHLVTNTKKERDLKQNELTLTEMQVFKESSNPKMPEIKKLN